MATMKALVTKDDHQVAVQDFPVPHPVEGEILVKVNYVAQNPTDWKAAAAAPPGRIVGCDFAGTVVEPNGSHWRHDQRVAGFVQGTSTNGAGARPLRGVFAEYCVVEASLVFGVPDGVADAQAAAVPLAFATAVQALVQRLGLPEPGAPAQAAAAAAAAAALPLAVLVNGGASSVGQYAIQLAKLGGLFVVATGSRRNHELLRALGADTAVDYSEEDWPEQVRKLTHSELGHALDCIAEKGTWEAIAAAMSPTKGGHIVGLLPAARARKKVEGVNKKVKAESTIVYTVFERPLNYAGFDNCGQATPGDKAVWEKHLGMLPELLSSGKIKPNRTREMGGLEDIVTGFQEQKEGKVSAQKLVYKVGATSGKLCIAFILCCVCSSLLIHHHRNHDFAGSFHSQVRRHCFPRAADGPLLYPLDPHRPDPPHPALRIDRLARLQEPDHHCAQAHRCPGRHLQRRLLLCLRAVAARLPTPLPAVHVHRRRQLAPRRLGRRRPVPHRPAAPQVAAPRQPAGRKTRPRRPLARVPPHGDELRCDRVRCPQRGDARLGQRPQPRRVPRRHARDRHGQRRGGPQRGRLVPEEADALHGRLGGCVLDGCGGHLGRWGLEARDGTTF